MRFGVNSLLFSGTFAKEDLRLLDHVRALGFDAFEVTPVDPAAFPAKEVRRRAADLGMIVNANFALREETNPLSSDKATRERAVDLSRRVVDLCLEAGVQIYCGANYCPWGYLPGRRTEDEWKWGVDSYRRIGEHALGTPLILAVETLGRFESHFLNTAADAVSFVEAVGLENCKVHLDTFHMIREEDDLSAAIRATGDRMAYFHACGSHRGAAGRDMVPWNDVFRALKEVGYDYCVTFESFNSQLQDLAKLVCIWRDFAASPEALASESLDFLKRKHAEIYGA
jgi:D-psicose/D-tagatose/L-ribulose 3-epimerase